MSDDFHRPTYTSAKLVGGEFEPTNEEGLYNPTQVRLYGIPGQMGDLVVTGPVRVSTYDTMIKIEIDLPPKPEAEKSARHLNDHIERAHACLEELKNRKDSDSPLKEFAMRFGARTLGPISLYASPPENKQMVSSGIMFGYAYEGHTYDFVKPKLLLVPTRPLRRIPKDDSGYDLKESEDYAVWIVDKLEECVQIEIDQGFIEQIVLEANLPGKRSPTQYRAMMTLGNRGG